MAFHLDLELSFLAAVPPAPAECVPENMLGVARSSHHTVGLPKNKLFFFFATARPSHAPRSTHGDASHGSLWPLPISTSHWYILPCFQISGIKNSRRGSQQAGLLVVVRELKGCRSRNLLRHDHRRPRKSLHPYSNTTRLRGEGLRRRGDSSLMK